MAICWSGIREAKGFSGWLDALSTGFSICAGIGKAWEEFNEGVTDGADVEAHWPLPLLSSHEKTRWSTLGSSSSMERRVEGFGEEQKKSRSKRKARKLFKDDARR